ncbi:Uncharacterised protein [Vibrio cholerae]|nr:Uncharacterised protein [Vibrio cholerae]
MIIANFSLNHIQSNDLDLNFLVVSVLIHQYTLILEIYDQRYQLLLQVLRFFLL